MHRKSISFKVSWQSYDLLWALVILIFIITKLPHLFVPYYWDEAWSYAPAIHLMHDAPLSLLPGTIPPDNYRGHPMLFYFMGGAWVKIFGTNYAAMHSFALGVAVAALGAFYRLIRFIYSAQTAFFSGLLLLLQAMFIEQSSMVLPEIAVLLWVCLGFLYYLKKQYLAYFFAATALILTKESGLVFFATILSVYSLDALRLGYGGRTWFVTCCKLAAPLVVYAAFLGLQKQVYGWYFFPDHVGYMTFDWDSVVKNMGTVAHCLFIEEKRKVLLFLPIVGVLASFLFGSRRRLNADEYHIRMRALALFGVYMAIYTVFSAINFFTNRYVLCCIPLYIALMVAPFMQNIGSKKGWAAALIGLFAAVFVREVYQQHTQGKGHMGSFAAMEIQQAAIDWVETHVATDATIGVGDFVIRTLLKDPKAGMLHRTNGYPNASWYIEKNAKICIFASFVPENRRDELLAAQKIKRIQRFEKGTHWIEIYEIDPSKW